MKRSALLPTFAAALVSLSACGRDAPLDRRTPVDASVATELDAAAATDLDASDGATGPDAGGATDAAADAASLETCNPGDVYSRVCGNCGMQSRSCANGAWGAWGPCTNEGVCAANESESEACGSAVGACRQGTRARTCDDTCQWGGWSACTGSVEPSPEVCGDGLDNDCNGHADEGCACRPVAPGHAGSFAITGSIAKLAAARAGCIVYGLRTGTQSQVVVFDGASKSELTRIDLPQPATDFDLSPDGTKLVVAHDAAHQLSVIETSMHSVAKTISVPAGPYEVEVDDSGIAYYVELDQGVDIYRVDLATGTSTKLANWPIYAASIELSGDGKYLYSGESGISGGNLRKWDVSGGGLTKVDQSAYESGYGFPPPSALYLSPGGQHAYYADHQLDAANLAQTRGVVGEAVLAEDLAGTFAVGRSHVFDAKLVRSIATLASNATAAVLTAEDAELWYYSDDDGRMHFANVEDYVGAASLGVRERAPASLSTYSFAKLVHDPVRRRLYGLDSGRNEVVVLDSASLSPVLAIAVGSEPTDLDVDAAGDYLYVGHQGQYAIALIDLTRLKFVDFLPTPIEPFEIEAMAGGKIAAIDQDEWTTPTLFDATNGAMLDRKSRGAYQGALTKSADGQTLFVGDSGTLGGEIARYSIASGKLVEVAKSNWQNYGFPYPQRIATALPDGSAVYYAGYLLDAADLNTVRYALSDPIVAVTPDGRLAISASKIYRVEDGSIAAFLSTSTAVHAVSPNSKTLYSAGAGTLKKLELSSY